MGVLAEALSLRLKEKEIKHTIKGDNNEAVIMLQRLEKTNVTMTVLFLTDDKNHSVSMRYYNYYKLEYRDITDELYRKLNDFNRIFNWGKITLEDNDIVIAMDALVTPINIGDICLELTYYGAQIADRVYSELESMKYKL